jgi:hypothetical protein
VLGPIRHGIMQSAAPPPLPGFFVAEFFGGIRFRRVRVLVLVACIIIFSLADLYMTLVHLLHFGMLEANPIARSIMEYGSPAALILWKLVTVGIAVAIFCWKRNSRAAEWGAAFCCCVLIWLTGRWITYNLHISSYTQEIAEAAGMGSSHWVTMSQENAALPPPQRPVRRTVRGGGTLSSYESTDLEVDEGGLASAVDPDPIGD